MSSIPRRLFVITCPEILPTETFAFHFIFVCGASYPDIDKFLGGQGISAYGIVQRRTFDNQHRDLFVKSVRFNELTRGQKPRPRVGKKDTVWEIAIGSQSVRTYYGKVKDDSSLSRLVWELPPCILLMEHNIFFLFESACRDCGVEVASFHSKTPLHA